MKLRCAATRIYTQTHRSAIENLLNEQSIGVRENGGEDDLNNIEKQKRQGKSNLLTNRYGSFRIGRIRSESEIIIQLGGDIVNRFGHVISNA